MRSLVDLLRSPDGRRLLESRGVTDDPAEFLDTLRPPGRPGLASALGVEAGAVPVYVGQQVQPDYPRSVTAKFRAARALEATAATPVVLWLDTDRAGAHKGQTAVRWGGGGAPRSARLVPRRWKDPEVRFVPVDESELRAAFAEMGTWLPDLPAGHRDAADDRLAAARDAVLGSKPGTLAEASRALASFLLERELSFAALPSAFASDLLGAGLLDQAMDDVLANLDDVIAVVNGGVESLRAQDVDPALKPVADDYLPLHVSCSRDGARRRLSHISLGSDHFAISRCPCGQEDRFHLGTGAPSLGELRGTDRWSPDVTLPVYLNRLTGGVVVGRSSALYGLVLNEVVDKVLGERPAPMLIPPDLGAVLADEREPNSLLFDYLTAP